MLTTKTESLPPNSSLDFLLSVFENPDWSAAFVPMAVKTVRLGQNLGTSPTEVEVVCLFFPAVTLALT